MAGIFNWCLGLCGFGQNEKPPYLFPERLLNLITSHFRGLLTVIICTAVWFGYGSHENRAVYMFIVMIVLFILKPMAVPTTSLIPIFFMPMTGLLISNVTTKFFNSAAALWVLGSMMHLLLNASDVDNFLAVKILSRGGFSPKCMVFKASLASFLMSIFSNRLQVSSKMSSFLTPTILEAQGNPATKTMKTLNSVVNSAIATSATIGGFVIVHGSIAPLLARSLWIAHNDGKMSWNYAQYTYFTFPIACGMFVFNLMCHFIYLYVGGVHLDGPATNALKTTIKNQSSELGKLNGHQLLSIFFTVGFYFTIMSRRVNYSALNVAGWQKPSSEYIEYVDDIVVVTAFVIALCILPRSCNFLKLIVATKESQLPKNKPDSAILVWKYTDSNVIYTYIFLFVAATVQTCALNDKVAFAKLQGFYYELKGLMIARVIICVVAANVMGDAASAFVCCILFSIGQENQGYEALEALTKIQTKERYPFLMACAVGCNLCFTSPFINTPAYFCKRTGKVSIPIMVVYGIPSLIGCTLILWVGAQFFIKYTYMAEYNTF